MLEKRCYCTKGFSSAKYYVFEDLYQRFADKLNKFALRYLKLTSSFDLNGLLLTNSRQMFCLYTT